MLKQVMAWAALLGAAFGMTLAQADVDFSGKFGLGVSGGVPFSVDSPRLRALSTSGWNAGANLRYHVGPMFGLGLGYDRIALTSGKNVSQDQLAAFAHLRLLPEKLVTPVLELGAGAAQTYGFLGSSKLPYTTFLGVAKLGVEYLMTPSMALGVFGRYSFTPKQQGAAGEAHVLGPMLSLTWYFSPIHDSAKKVAALPAQPAAPAPAPVPKPVDSDGDGVVDADDKCPGTPSGKRVNAFGCRPEEKVDFTLKINFPIGKATVDKKYDADLARVADFMKKYSNTKGEVQGHTDNVGLAANNEKLSASRAEAVRQVLVQKFGVEADRLTAKGYGPSQPVASNASAAGRAENRRVVVSIAGTATED